ncbi:MAG: YqcC family protein [Halioglobus sp.]|nr:YqcC family protein [Halioglobus sp.]
MNTEVAELLIDIEAELRQLGLWDRVPPPPAALASDQPFSIDTLTLPQWLQFIFLPTLYRLLEEAQPLPGRCGIAPLAQEYFRGMGLASGALEEALLQMDRVLSGEDSGGQ